MQETPKVTRGRNRGVNVGKTTRRDVMKDPCFYCGDKPESIDHLLPWSQGGTNARENLVAACRLCNEMKADMTYEDLIAFCFDLETAVSFKRGKQFRWFQKMKDHAPKILAWHAQKAKQLPVV